GQRLEARQPLGDCGGDCVAVPRNYHRGRVDAAPAAVGGDGVDDQVHELRPAIHTVFADEDLAAAGAVHLDGGIAGIAGDGALVTKDQCAAAQLEDGAAALVVGGVEAKGLRGSAGRDERLDDPVRRPRLLSPRLQYHR